MRVLWGLPAVELVVAAVMHVLLLVVAVGYQRWGYRWWQDSFASLSTAAVRVLWGVPVLELVCRCCYACCCYVTVCTGV